MPVPTTSQRHKLNRDPISDPHIILLEFQEDGQDAIERAAVNTEDVVSNGNIYSKSGISVEFPISGDGDVSATLRISNTSRVIGRAINAATQRINVRMMLIDNADPDTYIIDTSNLMVVPQATGDSIEITTTLGPRATLLEPVTTRRTTKQQFPGVWFA